MAEPAARCRHRRNWRPRSGSTERRSHRIERTAVKLLKECGFGRLAELHIWKIPTDASNLHTLFAAGVATDEDAWLDFMAFELPRLIADGWDVIVAEDFPYQVAQARGEIDVELIEGSGIAKPLGSAKLKRLMGMLPN